MQLLQFNSRAPQGQSHLANLSRTSDTDSAATAHRPTESHAWCRCQRCLVSLLLLLLLLLLHVMLAGQDRAHSTALGGRVQPDRGSADAHRLWLQHQSTRRHGQVRHSAEFACKPAGKLTQLSCNSSSRGGKQEACLQSAELLVPASSFCSTHLQAVAALKNSKHCNNTAGGSRVCPSQIARSCAAAVHDSRASRPRHAPAGNPGRCAVPVGLLSLCNVYEHCS
jgi:hypothetical protein